MTTHETQVARERLFEKLRHKGNICNLRRPAMFATVFVAMLSLIGCGDNATNDYTDEDTGSEVALSTGDTFTLRLGSNPSTGYSWEIDRASPLDIIELVSSTFEAPDTDSVGAAGTEVLEFAATGTGAGVLRLNYQRSFDDPPIPERIVEFIIRVGNAPWPPEDGSTPGTSSNKAPNNAAIAVAELLEEAATDSARVAGFVIWDDSGARLCQQLLESYPPQCGQPSVPIANPDALDFPFDETQDIRWTPNAIEVEAAWDGDGLTLD